MRVDQQACWVLHRRPWRESSLLLEIFSREHGRLGLIARGARSARSPWRGLSEPFIPLSCSWARRSDLGTLTHLEAEGARLALQGQALWCGLYVNELVLTLFGRDDPLPELYDVYASCLPALIDAESRATALRQIEIAMLSSLGVLPDLAHDAVRGDPILPDALYDVRPETGLVEARSSGPGIVHGRAALFLAGQAMQAPDPLTRREARLLTRRLIDHQLNGRELRTRELMRPLPRAGRQSDTDGAKE
jgi:DNA repair protein RecO (recombination protein O)